MNKKQINKMPRKKLGGNNTRTVDAVMNKSWKQHPTKQQVYGYLPPISQTTQARLAGHQRERKDKTLSSSIIPTHWPTSVDPPAKTYINQLCVDTGCCVEDQPIVMIDRDGVQERIKGIWYALLLLLLLLLMMILTT